MEFSCSYLYLNRFLLYNCVNINICNWGNRMLWLSYTHWWWWSHVIYFECSIADVLQHFLFRILYLNLQLSFWLHFELAVFIITTWWWWSFPHLVLFIVFLTTQLFRRVHNILIELSLINFKQLLSTYLYFSFKLWISDNTECLVPLRHNLSYLSSTDYTSHCNDWWLVHNV
jgi:hypothetical protein